MRLVARLPAIALAALWVLAACLWPLVPDRFPTHFDGGGHPDHFTERSLVSWFLLPGLATLLCLLFGWFLPRWAVSLAARNSPFLNVPNRRDFDRLPPAGRVRAMAPIVVLLRLLAAEMSLLFAAIQFATLRVATGDWARLPPALLFVALGTILATVVVMLPLSWRAVRRTLRQFEARGAAPTG